MAALTNHVSFSPIFREDNVLSVKPSSTGDSVTISNKSRSISIIKISDQKAVSSWSLRHSIEVTSPVVWDTTSEKYITVCNYQDIKVWEKDCTDLDKVKRKHAAVKVHEIFAVPQHEPVILCKNGSVNFLSNYKELSDSGPVKSDEDIVWSTAAEVGDWLVVAMITESKKGINLYCNFYKEESWQMEVTTINSPAKDVSICSCDCLTSKDAMTIYILWTNGDVTTLVVTGGSISPADVQQRFTGTHSNCCMVVIDTTHVAVAGVANKGEEGIAIFDLKFGVLDTWRPYPCELTQKPKLFYVAGHLFLPCQSMLYMYKVNCQPSTVASLLGQTTLPTDNKSPQSRYIWIPGRTSLVSHGEADLPNLLNATLNDRLPYPKFKEAFESLISALGNRQNSHWLTSGHMIQLVQRCLGEKKFWPNTELKQLIDMKCIPPGLMSETLDALVQHSDVALLDSMMSTQRDVPEKCLCAALSFYLECEDEKLSSAVESVPHYKQHSIEADTGQDACQCPLSSAKSFLINKVLMSPYSDVFLLECLKDVTFKHALKLLEYLCYLLSSQVSDEKDEDSQTSLKLSEVVDWLCLVLDSHMTQFVLSPDAHVSLIKLHCVVSDQVQFCDGLVSLEALLNQLKAKSELKQDKKIGHYCIEVLHIS